MQKITKQYAIDTLTEMQDFLSRLYEAVDSKKLKFKDFGNRNFALTHISKAFEEIDTALWAVENHSKEEAN